MLDAVFVVEVGFAQEGEIVGEPRLAFPGFDGLLHDGRIRKEGDGLAIMEEELVVGL